MVSISRYLYQEDGQIIFTGYLLKFRSSPIRLIWKNILKSYWSTGRIQRISSGIESALQITSLAFYIKATTCSLALTWCWWNAITWKLKYIKNLNYFGQLPLFLGTPTTEYSHIVHSKFILIICDNTIFHKTYYTYKSFLVIYLHHCIIQLEIPHLNFSFVDKY